MTKINLSHVKLMGIINLTPDSFSDGGKIDNLQNFMQVAENMLIEGATILDLGAESSGPNSVDITETEEAARLLPYLEALISLKSKYNFEISIDTYKGAIADQALQIGATIINDVTGLRGDPQMAETLAKHSCKIVIMYSKDPSARTTKTATTYTDVIKTITEFFEKQIAYAEANGINRNRIILDPGMGAFISTISNYSYQILERLGELKSHFKLPILVGTSLKSMHPFPLEQRLIPSVITATIGAINGADILRVHNVKEHYQAIKTLSFD